MRSSLLTRARLALALAGALFESTVHAQSLPSIDARTWSPSPDARTGLVLEPVATPGPWALNVGAWLHYAQNPFTLRRAGSDEVVARPVAQLFGADITAALGLGKIAAVGVSVPTVLYQDGTGALPTAVASNGSVTPSAIGDVTLFGKATLIENESHLFGFGLGAVATVSVPTGDRGSFMGEGSVTASARLLAEYSLAVARVHASLGYKVRTDHHAWPDASVGGVTFGDEIPWTFGFTLRPKAVLRSVDQGDRQVWELAVHGSLPAGPVAPFGLGDPGSARLSPTMLAVSDRIAIGHYRDFYAIAGVDLGLSTAVGVPAVRFVAGIGWAPREHDKDHDGIPDDLDQCEDLAEDRDGIQDADGCPEDDADGDGILDWQDACPLVPGVASHDPKKNGCPAPDSDGDGIPDPLDACPTVKGVKSADPNKNGCPPEDPNRTKDTDKDGIPDAHDACPEEPGQPHHDIDKHGCPPPDRDKDGIPDSHDACPDEKGQPHHDIQMHGCPNDDRDGDTYPNDTDRCPDEAETFNGIDDQDGCPDEGGRPLVVIDPREGYPVKLAKPLRFTGSPAQPDGDSEMTLRALAFELNVHHRRAVLTFSVKPARGDEAAQRADAIAKRIEGWVALTRRKDAVRRVAWDTVKARAGVETIFFRFEGPSE